MDWNDRAQYRVYKREYMRRRRKEPDFVTRQALSSKKWREKNAAHLVQTHAEYYQKNRETIRRQQGLYARGHYDENRERIISQTEQYRNTPEGRRARKISSERRKVSHPEQLECYNRYVVLVRSGSLRRGKCACCGAPPKLTDGHHEDYSEPGQVIWLCRVCHMALHQGRRRHDADMAVQYT